MMVCAPPLPPFPRPRLTWLVFPLPLDGGTTPLPPPLAATEALLLLPVPRPLPYAREEDEDEEIVVVLVLGLGTACSFCCCMFRTRRAELPNREGALAGGEEREVREGRGAAEAGLGVEEVNFKLGLWLNCGLWFPP